MRVSNQHEVCISRHFLFFFSVTFISSRLCSRVLSSLCKGKIHNIFQSFLVCVYHFSALLNPHFSHSFQCIILATLFLFVCTPSALVLEILTQYVQLFSQQHHTPDRRIKHFLHRPHVS